MGFLQLARFLFGIYSIVPLVKAQPQVSLGQAVIVGANGPRNTEFFGGIPFAEPPVGDLRFAPPVPITSLPPGNLDASKFGPSCPQSGSTASEDCLRLNIFRPAGVSADAKLPVMVWMYGGGFRGGSSSSFNATNLVAHSVQRGTPVIYASMNYRLAALGFPTGSEAKSLGILNSGLKDVITSLEWVQSNIASFGGDPEKVTFFGESAGAMGIGYLHFNSGLEKLVRAAILESGSPTSSVEIRAEESDDLWAQLVSMVPACAGASPNSTFTCLRQAPVADIVKASDAIAGSTFIFRPVIDEGDGLIPSDPAALVVQGKFSKIPFIGGTNLDEGTPFTPVTVNSTQAIVTFLQSLLHNSPTQTESQDFINGMLDRYPDDAAAGSPFNTGNQTFGRSVSWKRAAAMQGDILFQSARRLFINSASSRGVKAFGYLFTDPQPTAGPQGVTHGTEVAYVYGTSSSATGFGVLSPIMMDYWISFATSLDPNDGIGTERPAWPQFSPDSQVLLQLNSQNLTVIPDDYRVDALNWINMFPHILGH